jgi:hypothetical protein
MKPHAAHHIRRILQSAIFFIVCITYLQGLQAQIVYKCGNTYSQVACPEAQTVPVDDRRTPEQKQQADAATRRDAMLAQSLEKERLALEKSKARAPKPKRKTSSAAAQKKETSDDKTLTKITPKRPRRQAAKPEGFVAQVPASGPKSAAKK